MEHPYPSVQFEAEYAAEGTIRVPVAVTRILKTGSKVTVRLTNGVVSKVLNDRRVTEDEIEHISALQLEQRDHVIRFLGEEGTLAANSSFVKRAKALKGRIG